jgi:hypothetical protein
MVSVQNSSTLPEIIRWMLSMAVQFALFTLWPYKGFIWV